MTNSDRLHLFDHNEINGRIGVCGILSSIFGNGYKANGFKVTWHHGLLSSWQGVPLC